MKGIMDHCWIFGPSNNWKNEIAFYRDKENWEKNSFGSRKLFLEVIFEVPVRHPNCTLMDISTLWSLKNWSRIGINLEFINVVLTFKIRRLDGMIKRVSRASVNREEKKSKN